MRILSILGIVFVAILVVLFVRMWAAGDSYSTVMDYVKVNKAMKEILRTPGIASIASGAANRGQWADVLNAWQVALQKVGVTAEPQQFSTALLSLKDGKDVEASKSTIKTMAA